MTISCESSAGGQFEGRGQRSRSYFQGQKVKFDDVSGLCVRQFDTCQSSRSEGRGRTSNVEWSIVGGQGRWVKVKRSKSRVWSRIRAARACQSSRSKGQGQGRFSRSRGQGRLVEVERSWSEVRTQVLVGFDRFRCFFARFRPFLGRFSRRLVRGACVGSRVGSRTPPGDHNSDSVHAKC
jgi:hypothetical protein